MDQVKFMEDSLLKNSLLKAVFHQFTRSSSILEYFDPSNICVSENCNSE